MAELFNEHGHNEEYDEELDDVWMETIDISGEFPYLLNILVFLETTLSAAVA